MYALIAFLLGLAPTTPASPRPDLPFTGPPAIAYVADSVLHQPDGTTVQLPQRWGITGIVEYDGGYLVADDRIFEGTVGMQRLDAEGRIVESWAGTGSPVVSRDGRVAWVSLVAPESGGTGPTLLHVDSVDGGAEVTQEVRRRSMPFLQGWFRGRLVYETWGRDAAYLTDLVDRPRPIPPAEDLGATSPDGFLTARIVPRGVEVLTRSDAMVQSFVPVKGVGRGFDQLAWEDGRHLLGTLTRGQRMCVVRIDIRDGTLSRATDWQPASLAGFAFVAGP